MKFELKLIKDSGWTLETNDPTGNCAKCGKKLNLPFFFCHNSEVGYCRSCELSTSKRLCGSMEKEHEHFNIIHIKKVKK